MAFGLRFLLFSTLLGSRMRAVVEQVGQASEHVVRPVTPGREVRDPRRAGQHQRRDLRHLADEVHPRGTPHQAVVTAYDALGQLGFRQVMIATAPEVRGLGRMEFLDLKESRVMPAVNAVYGSLSTEELQGKADLYGEMRGYWALYLRATEQHIILLATALTLVAASAGLLVLALLSQRRYKAAQQQRGLVPGRLVAGAGRLRYHQPYATLPITHVTASRDGAITAEYLFDQPPRGCLIVTGSDDATIPAAGSFEHWCKERFWGFGPRRREGVVRFRVEHPAWAVRRVLACQLQLDFSEVFGREWGFLTDRKPESVVFAVGSQVSVYEPAAYGFHQ